MIISTIHIITYILYYIYIEQQPRVGRGGVGCVRGAQPAHGGDEAQRVCSEPLLVARRVRDRGYPSILFIIIIFNIHIIINIL